MTMRWIQTSRCSGRAGVSSIAWALAIATVAALAIGGCGDKHGDKKNPFATGNVSVAPQVEGRAAPTPMIPPPAPTPAP
jgi:hypothetical protein